VTFLNYILIGAALGAAILILFSLVGWRRRRAIAKARAESLYRANLAVEVWICRYCGLKSMMTDENCHWC